MMNCDPETGACILPDQDNSTESKDRIMGQDLAVHYIGDPMCSWCWGISPTVKAIETFCTTEDIDFSITMGGLRAGGGDPWSTAFKEFLRNEWLHISQATAQPFGFSLLEMEHFDYDTEPSCRAVVSAKLMQAKDQLEHSIALEFFSAIQYKFYVEGRDPKHIDFYDSICTNLGLDFDVFQTTFNSQEALLQVQQDFARCREWNIRSFPALVLETRGKIEPFAVGYVSTEEAIFRLQQKIQEM